MKFKILLEIFPYLKIKINLERFFVFENKNTFRDFFDQTNKKSKVKKNLFPKPPPPVFQMNKKLTTYCRIFISAYNAPSNDAGQNSSSSKANHTRNKANDIINILYTM